MPSNEKRGSARYQVEIDMTVVGPDGQRTQATTLNLSLSGALVRTATLIGLEVGHRVQVSFAVPELTAPISASADVRWVGDLDDAMLGLQFVTGLRAKETWALGRFLERQTPV
jgi:c-di-GMP-binding flagellar brake protein YcgR